MTRIFVCLFLLVQASVCGFALAQDFSANLTLDRLNSPDSAERLSASTNLQRMETRAVPVLMARLNLIAPLYLADRPDRSYGPFLADILNILSRIVENSDQNQSNKVIQKTRTCEFVANLARLAGNDDFSIRIPASKTLIRIVDDTTIELVSSFVLPMLKAGNLNGAVNLLLAVQVNSSTVPPSTKEKIIPIIGSIDSYLGSTSADAEKSQMILQDIKARLANNQRGDRGRDANPVEPCNPSSFLTNASAKPMIAYIHTASSTLPPDTRVRLQSAIQGYGIKVGGLDGDVDSAGGFGVDYFDEADRPVAQQMADSIGTLISRPQFLPRKQNSKLNQQGVFGIWLPPPQ
jgi:hypothetical protein